MSFSGGIVFGGGAVVTSGRSWSSSMSDSLYLMSSVVRLDGGVVTVRSDVISLGLLC